MKQAAVKYECGPLYTPILVTLFECGNNLIKDLQRIEKIDETN